MWNNDRRGNKLRSHTTLESFRFDYEYEYEYEIRHFWRQLLASSRADVIKS